MNQKTLILASTSIYRHELLSRLRIPFEVVAPAVDETPMPLESPQHAAERLARAKADAVARHHPDAIVIGCDQVAVLDGEHVGKPGGREAAIAQLGRMRGKEVLFHTALCVVHGASAWAEQCVVLYRVRFRPLTDAQIERYVDLEQPYDCAGSARCEGLGIALLEYMRGDDPTALIGLPLIALTGMLDRAGIRPL